MPCTIPALSTTGKRVCVVLPMETVRLDGLTFAPIHETRVQGTISD